jgi:RimJ/RimL family protein N-acetyltransferase
MIELQPFECEDIPRLLSWVPDEKFMVQWSGPFFRYPLTEQQLVDYWKSGQETNPVRRIFKAVHLPGQDVIGHIEINAIDRRNQCATLGRILMGAPQYRGKGLGAQMVKQAVKIAFEEMGLHRLDLRVYDFNLAAIQCYLKVGFTIEGRHRDTSKVGDEYWSIYMMSMLESEWREKASSAKEA